MVADLARLIGANPDSVSKHLKTLVAAGFVAAVYGGHYAIPARFRPDPQRKFVDFDGWMFDFDRISPGTATAEQPVVTGEEIVS